MSRIGQVLRVSFAMGVTLAVGACGSEREPPATAQQTASHPATTLPPSPQPSGQSVSFERTDRQGYTYRVDLTQLTVTADIANSPPGQKAIVPEFDWSVTNTTPGRNYSLPTLSLFVAVPADGCAPGNDPRRDVSRPGLNYCQGTIAHIGPVCATYCSQTLAPGQSSTGHYSFDAVDPSKKGGVYYPVKESFDLSGLFIGFPGLPGIWKSPTGAPVPSDLH